MFRRDTTSSEETISSEASPLPGQQRSGSVQTQPYLHPELVLHPALHFASVHGWSRTAGGPAACVYMENVQLQARLAESKACQMVIRESGALPDKHGLSLRNQHRTSQCKGKLVARNSTEDLCGHSACVHTAWHSLRDRSLK